MTEEVADSQLALAYAVCRPDEVALLLAQRDAVDVAAILTDWPIATSVAVAQLLAVPVLANLMPSLGDDLCRILFGTCSFDKLVAVLRLCPDSQRQRLFELLDPTAVRHYTRVLEADLASVGSLMNPRVFVGSADDTVGAVLAASRAGADVLGEEIFVVDGMGKLVGVTSIAELFRSSEEDAIRDRLRPVFASLSPLSPLSAVTSHPAWLETNELPVVDASDVFLGVLSRRTLRRHDMRHHIDDVGRAKTVTLFGELFTDGVASVFGDWLADADSVAKGGNK